MKGLVNNKLFIKGYGGQNGNKHMYSIQNFNYSCSRIFQSKENVDSQIEEIHRVLSRKEHGSEYKYIYISDLFHFTILT